MDETNTTYLPMCGCDLTMDVTSLDNYSTYNVALIAIMLPILAVFGIFGNIFNVVVYSQPKMHGSLNFYLAFLAVSDFMVTLGAVFMFTFEALRTKNANVRTIYLNGIPYVFPLAMIAQTCSVYYTVAAGVDCFISIIFPQSEKTYCTKKRAIIVGIVVFLLSLVYNITRWYEVEVVQCYDYSKNTTHVDVCPSELRQNNLYNEIYYLNMYTIIMSVGPLIVLLVLNILVVRATLTKRRKRWVLTAGGVSTDTLMVVTRGGVRPAASQLAAENESADTVSLICVVCLFLFCNALSLAINFIETFTDVGSAMGYLIDLSNFLVVFNSSVNFFIYISFGSKFRATFLKLFEKKKKPRNSRKKNKNNRRLGLARTQPMTCSLFRDGSDRFVTKSVSQQSTVSKSSQIMQPLLHTGTCNGTVIANLADNKDSSLTL